MSDPTASKPLRGKSEGYRGGFVLLVGLEMNLRNSGHEAHACRTIHDGCRKRPAAASLHSLFKRPRIFCRASCPRPQVQQCSLSGFHSSRSSPACHQAIAITSVGNEKTSIRCDGNEERQSMPSNDLLSSPIGPMVRSGNSFEMWHRGRLYKCPAPSLI